MNRKGGTMVPGSPRVGSEAKSRLVKTAVLLFAEKGYVGVGIREIAGAASQNCSLISYLARLSTESTKWNTFIKPSCGGS